MYFMDLGKICIVLVRPEESRNIGAACRALANNDIADLRIVGEKSDYEDGTPRGGHLGERTLFPFDNRCDGGLYAFGRYDETTR